MAHTLKNHNYFSFPFHSIITDTHTHNHTHTNTHTSTHTQGYGNQQRQNQSQNNNNNRQRGGNNSQGGWDRNWNQGYDNPMKDTKTQPMTLFSDRVQLFGKHTVEE